MVSGHEPARFLDLSFLLRLKDRTVCAGDRNGILLTKGCAGQSETNRNRTSATEPDFVCEANHAVSI
jgi:hypothetical protein